MVVDYVGKIRGSVWRVCLISVALCSPHCLVWLSIYVGAAFGWCGSLAVSLVWCGLIGCLTVVFVLLFACLTCLGVLSLKASVCC